MTVIALEPVFLDKRAAAAFIALSESTFEQLVREGSAPKPRALSARRVGWLVRELRAWADARPVSEMLPPSNTGASKASEQSSERKETRC
jgi:prophage regulatory protein